MNITHRFTFDGKKYTAKYSDIDDFRHLPINKCKQVYAVAVFKGKILFVYNGKRQEWGLAGGTVEPGESLKDCLFREIKEESNMKVTDYWPVGAAYIPEVDVWQVRYACKIEPYGPFISDPAGSITKIELVNPIEYNKYFDWGKMGDHIINRGLKLIDSN